MYFIRNLLRYIINAEHCISSIPQGIAYHQHEVLYIIIAKADTAYGWWYTRFDEICSSKRMRYTLRRDDIPLLSQWINKKGTFGRQKFLFCWWGMVDSDHRSQWQQIYSLPPLAAREIPQIISWTVALLNGAGDRSRTNNLLITNQLLCHWATPACVCHRYRGDGIYYSISRHICQAYFWKK